MGGGASSPQRKVVFLAKKIAYDTFIREQPFMLGQGEKAEWSYHFAEPKLTLDLDGSAHTREQSLSSVFPIIVVPDSLREVPSALLRLVLRANEITFLPPEMGSFACLSQLEVLDVSHNRLEVVPSQLSGLRELRALFLNHNYLTRIPADLFVHCTKLGWLNASTNRIQSLPEALFSHGGLEVLNMSSNKIKTLERFCTPKLRILNLSTNKIGSQVSCKDCVCLTDINLARNPCRFTVRVDRHTPVQLINQASNAVFGLPPKFSTLSALRQLILASNELRNVPSVLFSMENLELLNLSHNKIKEIPKDIAKIHNLHSLYLKQNEVETLPSNPLKLEDDQTATLCLLFSCLTRYGGHGGLAGNYFGEGEVRNSPFKLPSRDALNTFDTMHNNLQMTLGFGSTKRRRGSRSQTRHSTEGVGPRPLWGGWKTRGSGNRETTRMTTGAGWGLSQIDLERTRRGSLKGAREKMSDSQWMEAKRMATRLSTKCPAPWTSTCPTRVEGGSSLSLDLSESLNAEASVLLTHIDDLLDNLQPDQT
uniref:Uncharacterized protein n=1 Tax=Chromera velia CCMP2878 TaxID=1169474 RepID=A0A0G4F7N8_9ALVE|eukprot:Cvel_15490.t1-p1 / transcript=Cvel_15490.t1 / gene=Cvel_15490 / organism=Chromera_velia_CCMP2878 / gene_product=Leucine-rich repeat protein SHOC-2, putative / transcript_product=Leucine-rich repeat protein SHOC-2, putative / location=Cvel_scaffold1149:28187-31651(+) / protein_length=535 / sequence_SO=supercontig / SO=protein_coding / is_pseudo=false